ncbi:zf-TFIIB domain-containing protein [Carboxylicivirga sp. A043]|uniref:TFIIB-type zinc ribbon-containing protein n=1 Tax=Carboxylicivirga litoralis TaxID=2816963 RepID=UPI0021CAF048|nr:zf-TFIIB domain-containing protein [Carboxylicivirga sp. A043]MCU4156542.1 zf-TFIIB domain-containing protein [Carboxylicivirga sp. A043]
MNCPRCNQQLSIDYINDCKTTIEVDRCTCCGGIWFDKDELSQIEGIIEPTFIEIRHLPDKKEQFEKLHCPKCNNSPRLQKAVHPRDKKVIIDYCPYCKGIWLDKGELEAIQQESFIITIGKIFNFLSCLRTHK